MRIFQSQIIFYISLIFFFISSSEAMFLKLNKKKIVSTLLCTFLSLPFSSSSVLAKVENDPKALSRFDSVQQELQNLDNDWEKISSGGGDNIRRVLGTVYSVEKGCVSPLCGYTQFQNRFIKDHVDDLDISEFDEPSRDLLESLNQADFLAYSSIFSEYGNGGGGSDYIKDSRKQIKRAIAYVKQIIEIVSN